MKTENAPKEVDELKSILEQIEQGDKAEEKEEADAKHPSDDSFQKREINILNLPPRKEIHSQNRLHVKFNRPLARLIFIILLLAAFLAGVYYFLGDELPEFMHI